MPHRRARHAPAFSETDGRGALAYDPMADTLYVSDGTTIAEYAADGTALRGWEVSTRPGVVSGMAFDSGSGVLYIAATGTIVGVVPPRGCEPATVVVGPWPTSELLLGLTWDADDDVLWGIDGLARVYRIEVGRDVTHAFDVPLDGSCGPLGIWPQPWGEGIAIDATTTDPGGLRRFFVTDGHAIVCVNEQGVAAAPTPLVPEPCEVFDGLFPTVFGLARTARGARVGTGSAPGGGPVPALSSSGSFLAGAGASIHLDGGPPDTLAWLLVQVGTPGAPGLVCPPATFLGGNVLHLAPPLAAIAGPLPAFDGSVDVPVTIPDVFPADLAISLQGVVGDGPGGFAATNGLLVSPLAPASR